MKKDNKLKNIINTIGVARLIIGGLLALVLIMAVGYGLDLGEIFTNILRRYGMWGILVLAIVPGIQCGIGPNFGISLGIVCGLVTSLFAIEFELSGIPAFMFAAGVGAFIAAFVGLAYGWLLNKVKGSEMTVSTYIGYSAIAIMNIYWVSANFESGIIKWPIGGVGVRSAVSLEGSFSGVLDGLWAFNFLGVTVPTGIILLLLGMCALVWFFFNTKTGKAMSAAGNNPTFARASGINVDRMRMVGTAISTSLAAVGIVSYASTYGFLQLYDAPLQMGFQAVAALFIGGASPSKAKISHVLIGAFLFQGLMVAALPVANRLLAGTDISDIIRMIVQNAVIIYAITKANGGGNE